MISREQFIINEHAHQRDWQAMDRADQLMACAHLQAKAIDENGSGLLLDVEPTLATGWAHWLPPVREAD